MQVINNKKSIFRRILAYILSFCVLLSCVIFSVSATSFSDLYDGFFYTTDLITFVLRCLAAGALDEFLGGQDETAEFYYKNSPYYCSATEDATGGRRVHDLAGSTLDDAYCEYCGISWAELKQALIDWENTSVSDLDSSTASSGIVVSGYSASLSVVQYDASPGRGFKRIALDYPDELFSLIRTLGINDKVMIFSVSATSIAGCYFNEDGLFCLATFTNPLDVVNSSLFGVYDLASLSDMQVLTYPCTYCYPIYYNKAYAEASSDFLLSTCFAFDWNSSFFISSSGVSFNCFRKQSVNSTWDSNLFLNEVASWGQVSSTWYYPNSASISWDNSHIILQPTGSDDTSRVSSMMSTIGTFNLENGFLENDGVVNFYIGSMNTDDTLADIYSPDLYDEETLVFTEPVTGAQYQTTGWTYDYTSRAYDITLDSGTFAIDGTDITQIICTYGDEAVTIDYYDSTGAVIQSDEYAYVMVSQSSCALAGHSYNVETTKEPTCTSSGERVYTCSVCGDQKVEDVPANAHASTYSVFKEPTCTESGVALYTCSTCGTQYSETIEALGHDWLSTEIVETTYTLPEGTSCPDCAGTDFTCELDEASATYSCTCSSCGSSWTIPAEVIHGHTSYVCSICGAEKTEHDGEEGDGLFTSIGNFFADGIIWCTEKLSLLVDNLTAILDTFNSYLEVVGEQNSSYPTFLGQIVALLPEDLMAVIWFAVVACIVVAVIKVWFQ